MIRMGYRLSKIYTRTGDEGTTGLGDGTRVPKDNARVEAFGDVDELNSALGVLLAHTLPEALRAPLVRIQHDLFEVGGELPHLKEFILPGGGPAAAACHLVRAVCRRAERRVVTLARGTEVNPQALIYLNRLSDLLFVLARVL